MNSSYYCIVCEEKNILYSHFRFPSNSVDNEKWHEIVKTWKPTIHVEKRSVICEVHFADENINCEKPDRKILKFHAIPQFATADDKQHKSAENAADLFDSASSTSEDSAFLNTALQEQCIESNSALQGEIKSLKRQLNDVNQRRKRLQRAHTRLQAQAKAGAYYRKILKSIEAHAMLGEKKAICLLEQVKNFSRKKPAWCEVTLRNCVMWRTHCPKGYDFANKHLFTLPSRATLYRYGGQVSILHTTSPI